MSIPFSVQFSKVVPPLISLAPSAQNHPQRKDEVRAKNILFFLVIHTWCSLILGHRLKYSL